MIENNTDYKSLQFCNLFIGVLYLIKTTMYVINVIIWYPKKKKYEILFLCINCTK